MASAIASKAGPVPPSQAASMTAHSSSETDGLTPNRLSNARLMTTPAATDRIAIPYFRIIGDARRQWSADVDMSRTPVRFFDFSNFRKWAPRRSRRPPANYFAMIAPANDNDWAILPARRVA